MTDQTAHVSSVGDQQYPRPRYAWYVASLLFVIYVLSYIDRYILSLLIEPIKESLELTDFQIGILLGPAFVLFYVIMGLPMGWLADRKKRTIIVAVAITFWSFMTAACGLARTFLALLLARIGVGVGEASLSPCTVSLIGDYFPKETRPRAVALWMTGAPLGAGGTYILGGQVIEMIRNMPPVVLPVFGELFAWQTAFLVVGLPGVLIAAVFYFTVKEPKRQERLKTETGEDVGVPSVREALQYFKGRWKAYSAVFVGIIGITGTGAASFWSPALFERTWGWGIADSGLALGAVFLTSGFLGTNFGGWLAAWLVRRGIDHGPYITVFIGIVITFPAFTVFPLMPTAELGIVALFVGVLGMSITSGTSPSAIIAITPSELRGQASALFFLIINLLGAQVAPPMVGLITDLFGDPSALKYGMAITFAFFGILMNLAMFWGYKHFRQSAADMTKFTQKELSPA